MSITRWTDTDYISGLRKLAVGLLTAFFVAAFLGAQPARADIAPPESPPGSNPVPGSESTQVRMVAETVTLDVLAAARGDWPAQAAVTAEFQMLNLGEVEERLEVRFPLGWNDGFFRYPEIRDLQARVNGRSVPVRRVEMPEVAYMGEELVPWAVFEVVFPPGETVEIQVRYTADGFGETPNVAFKYLLETGAGWKDTIGTADIVVRLPYEANAYNVLLDGHTGYSSTTPGATIAGNELRWRFEDLEPGREDNFEVSLVFPQIWRNVLLEQERVKANPQDGEAWGRLGKLYKEITRLRRAMRADDGGQALYLESIAAYEKAVTLKPDDALWHFGFADLLWYHFYWHVYWEANRDLSELERAANHLQRSLALDPGNERALALVDEIAYEIPGAVERRGDQVVFLILTATPEVTLPWEPEPSETPEPQATATPLPEPSAAPTSTASPEPETQAGETFATETPLAVVQAGTAVSTPAVSTPAVLTPANAADETSAQGRAPLCGGALAPVLLALWYFSRRRA